MTEFNHVLSEAVLAGNTPITGNVSSRYIARHAMQSTGGRRQCCLRWSDPSVVRVSTSLGSRS